MPWKASGASRHKKGLSASQKRKWAKIANGVRRRTGSDASAIRIANARVGRRRKRR